MKEKRIVIWLSILQIFIGIGAVPCGLMMIIDPSGQSIKMNVDMLVNSPFKDFLIPGIFLFSVNGILSLIGAVATFKRHKFAGVIAVGLGAFLIFWIISQVLWLGIHWLHFPYMIIGIVELVLGLKLKFISDRKLEYT